MCGCGCDVMQGFSELGMNSESAALRSLFFGQVSNFRADLSNNKTEWFPVVDRMQEK